MKRQTCNSCKRPLKQCYCHTICPFQNKKPILVIRHVKEKEHPFNTARMADLTFQRISVIDSNHEDKERIIQEFIEKYEPYLLFKTSHSKMLDSKASHHHKGIIVLDGTWDKAKSILFSSKRLQELAQFHLDVKEASIYKSVRSACSKEFLSTFEAIIKAVETDEEMSLRNLLSPLEFLVREQKKWSQ